MAATATSVVHPDDVEPHREDGDTAEVRITFDRSNGCELLEQRVVRFTPGRSVARRLEARQEVLYVVSGRGEIEVDGERHGLEPDMGVFVAPGESFAVENPGPDDITAVSVVAPRDRGAAGGERRVTVRFADRPELPASSERTFKYLINEDVGCVDVTQFVGIVQPSKAPFHSHTYDEVGYVVEGEGTAHIEGESTPLHPGFCFHLMPGQLHCIENTGPSPMRILGVFHPSGSPASRTYEGNNESEASSKTDAGQTKEEAG
jgi:mannose-6-phosphate isomerase-like protein (cupin superfamily)